MFSWLFNSSNFTPHGFCVAWNPFLVWADSIADGLIALAYFSIPVALVVFVMRRRDIGFQWVFALFGTFILFCGLTHVIDAITFWVPAYGIEAVLRMLTAVASVGTAIALWPLMPRALALPGALVLRALNDERVGEATQRREAEASLRDANSRLELQVTAVDRSEQRFRLMVESVADYAIFMLDPAGIVVSWNVGAERIKGYRDSEILGRHFTCFYTDDDMKTGNPGRGLEIAAAKGRFEGEGWRVRKDGSRFWANVVISAMRAPDGELLGFGKVTCDLTERMWSRQALKRANEELESRVEERTRKLVSLTERFAAEIEERKATEIMLRETTELLEATFDAAPFPIIVTTPAGEVLMWNRAGETTFGYSVAEMKSRGFGLLVPDDRWAEANRIINAARVGNVATDSRIPHRDGRMLDVRLSVAPIFRADGAPRAIVTAMVDLTEKNHIDAQLRQSQKLEAIGTLTGGMAHDFNNLLGIIIGNLDLLRDARNADALIMELAGEALDAATRGADLTRRLLAFARRQPLQSRRLDLDVLIGDTVRLLDRLLGEDVEINVDLAQGICAVTADPGQLEAALTNLATNARDAMPRGGKLTIATGHRTIEADYASANPEVQPGEYAMIEVTDTGAGMPPEIKNRIFEPFFSTKGERGTGLGLSMVFGFIKQSGGHISVYSEVGVGTTFRLYLPCTNDAEEARIAAVRPGGPLAGRGETVLAVEDNLALRRLVVRQLGGFGYRVLEAGTGAEALEILNTGKIDLLFTDVVMPGGSDGFELAETAARRWPDIKVILTSGFPLTRFNEDFGGRAMRLLSKPYRKDALARLIREALDGADANPGGAPEGRGSS